MNLCEAFRALDALNEDVFSFTDAGIEKLSEFEHNDDLEDNIKVIDTEAETEDDLLDSYVGKVILDCSVCHSKLYKDKEEVELDEEEQLANVGEECPYCYTSDGFKVIGEVAAFEEDDSDDVEDVSDEEVEEESLTEGIFDFGKKKAAKKELEKQKKLAQQQADRDRIAKEQEKAERERGQRIAQRWKETEDNARNAKKEYERERYNSIKGSNVSNTGKTGVHYSGGDYYSEGLEETTKPSKYINTEPNSKDLDFVEYAEAHPADENDNLFKNHKDIKESVNNVNVETDDSIVNVSTDDDGKITVTTEPNVAGDATEGEEVLAPISPETQAEIEGAEEEVLDDEATDEVDAEVDEFDEESFDELGESYLKNIYENVNGYKTTKVSSRGNKLFIEGNINFKSGKVGKTSFMFEAKDITPSGTARFIGENKNITRGKKSFIVKGKLSEGKFISESLNYNYRAKDDSGKSTRVYGTVRVGK